MSGQESGRMTLGAPFALLFVHGGGNIGPGWSPPAGWRCSRLCIVELSAPTLWRLSHLIASIRPKLVVRV
jgi:hypothetical protein